MCVCECRRQLCDCVCVKVCWRMCVYSLYSITACVQVSLKNVSIRMFQSKYVEIASGTGG